MPPHVRSTAFGLVFWLAAAGGALAVAPEIKDEGKIFSPDAVKKANEEIREIARKYDRDLLIETFPAVLDNQTDKVKAMPRAEREKFFHDWAMKRMTEVAVNGIYVLVCKEPGHVQVEVSPRAKAVFDTEARNKLVALLVSKFREKHFDEGLTDSVKSVRETLAASAARTK